MFDRETFQKLHSPLEEERETAINALLTRDDLRIIAVMRNVYRDDLKLSIRYLAYHGLAQMKETSAKIPELKDVPDRSLPLVISGMLGSADPGKHENIIRYLVTSDHRQSFELLSRFLKIKNKHEEKALILRAIGLTGNEKAIPLITQYLTAKRPAITAAAVEALALLKDFSGYRTLFEMYPVGSEYIKQKIIEMHFFLPVKDLVNFLSSAARSGKKEGLSTVLGIAGEIGMPFLAPAVAAVAKSEKEPFAGRAGELLEKLTGTSGGKEKVDGTRTGLAEEYSELSAADPEVKLNFIKDVVSTSRREVLPALAKHLKHEKSERILATLVLAIGHLGSREHVDDIAVFLKSTVNRVVANTVESLGMIGGDKAMGLIKPYLNHADNRTRANAIVALKDVPETDIATPLGEMLNSGHDLMQRSAIWASLNIGDVTCLDLLEDSYWKSADDGLKKNIRHMLEFFSERDNPQAAGLLRRIHEKISRQSLDVERKQLLGQHMQNLDRETKSKLLEAARKETAERKKAEAAEKRALAAERKIRLLKADLERMVLGAKSSAARLNTRATEAPPPDRDGKWKKAAIIASIINLVLIIGLVIVWNRSSAPAADRLSSSPVKQAPTSTAAPDENIPVPREKSTKRVEKPEAPVITQEETSTTQKEKPAVTAPPGGSTEIISPEKKNTSVNTGTKQVKNTGKIKKRGELSLVIPIPDVESGLRIPMRYHSTGGGTTSPAMGKQLEDARFQFKQGNLGEAQRLFGNVISSDTGNGEALNGLGMIAREQGRLDEAEEFFNQSIEAAPTALEPYITLGHLYLYEKNDTDSALVVLKKAHAIQPGQAFTCYLLGTVYHDKGDMNQAEHYFRQALKAGLDDPLDIQVRTVLAEYFIVNRQYDNARIHLDSIKNRFPEQSRVPRIRKLSGLVQLHNRRFREAEAELKAAERHFPRDKDITFGLGVASFHRNKMDRALAHFEKTVILDPGHGEAHFYLGRLYEARGEFTRAITAYKVVLDSDFVPGSETELRDRIFRISLFVDSREQEDQERDQQ